MEEKNIESIEEIQLNRKNEVKKKISYLIIYLLGMSVIGFFTGLYYSLAGITDMAIITEKILVLNFPVMVIIFILGLILFRKEILSSYKRYFSSKPILKVLALFASYIVVVILNVLIANIVGLTTPENQSILNSALSKSSITTTIYIVLIAPVIEEIIFRHIIYKELAKLTTEWIGAFVSFALFVLVHSFVFPELLSYVPLSIAITALYGISKKEISYSISFHILNNFLAIILMFLAQLA